ncbi:alpha/beta fold hydrolase [Blattabacterium cuenoti]|uniref:alpha/beta fold hydrolase n=1 Tax=Blattabacterium cuenoti TaxID=1653831 RepID=UPI00163BDE35|nr:alpha/beta fold hydrolase [Blattabacterium cuenoti]
MKILSSKIFGLGPSILVFHGLFGNGENWISFANKFSSDYQIHLIDIRNHGSSFFSKKMNYDIISDDILNYINFYKLYNPILLGHSMGGRAVMNFSIKYPLIPKKIIIVDISPKFHDVHHNFIPILKKVNFNLIKTRNDLNIFLKLYIKDSRIRNFFSKCVGINSNGKLYFRFYLKGIEKNYNILIKKNIKIGKYSGPTIFLRGEYSDYIPINDKKYIKKIFPKSLILTIKKSGHWIHVDNSKEFYKEICIFLNKKSYYDLGF